MIARALPIPGEAVGITIRPNVNADGRIGLTHDRDGSGWAALSLAVEGPRGGGVAYLSMTAGQARDAARKLYRAAAFLEARTAGNAGPCQCTAWSHNLYDCPNDAALDYSMCRDCWTPERGQTGLDMGHGNEDDPHRRGAD